MTASLLTTSFLTSASLSVTISLSSAMICRSSGRLSLFLNFSSVPSSLDTDRTCGRKSRKACNKVDNIITKRVTKPRAILFASRHEKEVTVRLFFKLQLRLKGASLEASSNICVTYNICRAEILSLRTSWALLKSASMICVSL